MCFSRQGSLIIDFNMKINETSSPDYATSANTAMGGIARSGLAVGGVTLAAKNVKVTGTGE